MRRGPCAQVYAGGEPCDVTGAPRRTEVRFGCGEAAGRDALSGLREPATCSYVLHLATPRLCAHPAFRVAEPPVRAILCHPANADSAAPAAQPCAAAEREPRERMGLAPQEAGLGAGAKAPRPLSAAGGAAGLAEAGQGGEPQSSAEDEAEAAELSRHRSEPRRKRRPSGDDGEL